MALSAAQIVAIENLCQSCEGGMQLVAEFKQAFPGVSLTRCEASDMGSEEPYRRLSTADLYLLDRREHCWSLTHDPGVATGVVLARHGGRR